MDNQNLNLSILIKLFCFKEDIIGKSHGVYPLIFTDIFFVKKNILEKYKKFLHFEEISSYLKKHYNILDYIKVRVNQRIDYTKLTDSALSHIIINIKKDLYKKIEKKI